MRSAWNVAQDFGGEHMVHMYVDAARTGRPSSPISWAKDTGAISTKLSNAV
jgi:hypothetical protein